MFFISSTFIVSVRYRGTPRILHAIRQGRRVHHHARLGRTIKVLCVPHVRRGGLRECGHEPGTFSGWKDRTWFIRPFICYLFLLSVGPFSFLPLSSTRFSVLFLTLLSFFVHAVPHTDRRPPSFESLHVCRSTRSALSRGRNTNGPQNSS